MRVGTFTRSKALGMQHLVFTAVLATACGGRQQGDNHRLHHKGSLLWQLRRNQQIETVIELTTYQSDSVSTGTQP